MAEIQMNDLPFAVAVLTYSEKNCEDFVVFQCNDAFSAFFGQDTQGMALSAILECCADADGQDLLREIAQKAKAGVPEFVCCGGNGAQYDVRLRSSSGRCIVCIAESVFGDQEKFEEEIAYLSFHDKLTGLYNRAYFERKIKEYDRERYYPVSIIMGDANGLKMTNDIFGHAQGDAVLTSIANILSLACRDNDIVARYGGDEFVVLMPNTPLEEAARVSKNILRLCSSQDNDKNNVSISLGYACKERVTESMNETLNVAEDFMYRHKLLESRSYRSSVISSLKKMLFEKSFETEEHAMRLTGLCAETGQLLGLSQSELNDLELFSMLHDIGKIGVKDQILLKPGKLTDEEWIEMRKHSDIGYRIAQSAPELSHIADYILCHHEHYDGTGYPQGLKGEQIPLLSRILAVADTYDAMVNDRYYRKALSSEAAIAELKKCSGTQFDPRVVDAFLKILEPKPPKLAVLPPKKRFA
jgi:diguanylate cyclase (GGDEF) domain